jgi:1-acyl-sn-glycerol-3-phosphate acyltransferase
MRKSLTILVTGVMFVGFTFFGALISYVILPLAVLGLADRHERSRRARRTLGRCARLYLEVMRLGGLYRITQPRELPEPLRRGGPAMIISNHPSLLDVMWLAALIPDAAYLAKASWFHSPFISPILRHGDHVCGPAESSDNPMMAGAVVLDAMLERLRHGTPLLVFPEGTRSPPRGIGSFHPGAFEAARRAGVPIVAVFMRLDPPTLVKGQKWYAVPDRRVHVEISILDVVTPAPQDTARDLRRRFHARYSAVLAEREGRVPGGESAPVVDAHLSGKLLHQ